MYSWIGSRAVCKCCSWAFCNVSLWKCKIFFTWNQVSWGSMKKPPCKFLLGQHFSMFAPHYTICMVQLYAVSPEITGNDITRYFQIGRKDAAWHTPIRCWKRIGGLFRPHTKDMLELHLPSGASYCCMSHCFADLTAGKEGPASTTGGASTTGWKTLC